MGVRGRFWGFLGVVDEAILFEVGLFFSVA